VNQGDKVLFKGVQSLILSGAKEIPAIVGGREVMTLLEVSERELQDLLAGGTLNYVRKAGSG